MYLVYKTGRRRLPPDSYKRSLDALGDKCSFIDATEISDSDLHACLLAQIESYANPYTHIYFLQNEEDFRAIQPNIKTGIEVSLKNTYRTGSIDIPPDFYTASPASATQEIHVDVVAETLPEQDCSVAKSHPDSTARHNVPCQEDTSVPKQPITSADPSEDKQGRGGRRKSRKKNNGVNTAQTSSESQNSDSAGSLPDPHSKSGPKEKPPRSTPQSGFSKADSIAMFMNAFGKTMNEESQQFPGSSGAPPIEKVRPSKEEREQAKARAQEKWGSGEESVASIQDNAELSSASQASESPKAPEVSNEETPASSVAELSSAECQGAVAETGTKSEAAHPPVESREFSTDSPQSTPPSTPSSSPDPASESPKKKWADRVSAPERKAGAPLVHSKREDLEKAIFGAVIVDKVEERVYTPLDDAKAQMVTLFADRFIQHAELLIKGIKKHEFSFEEYMELISTLVRSDNINDFKEGWGIVHPGCTLDIEADTYIALRNEAMYYTSVCDTFFVGDKWG
jgi:hypothetical protein